MWLGEKINDKGIGNDLDADYDWHCTRLARRFDWEATARTRGSLIF
jgi:hypothetical protein